MIARIWSARSSRENATRYLDHFERAVAPALSRLDGYVDATVLQRHDANTTHITVVTRWRAIEAVQRFAGADIGAAVVDDEAAAVLTDWDRRVQHYEVAFEHSR